MNIVIRPETPLDVTAIAAVTEAAFHDAPHTDHTEQFIVAALRKAGALTVSLVAVVDGVIAGHVAASPVEISDGTRNWFGLGPLSVLPAYQRCGIGAQLVQALLETLKQRNAAGCVLLGDPAYYHRFGFRTEPAIVLPDVPPEYFQVLVFGGALPAGTVAYHEGFAARG